MRCCVVFDDIRINNAYAVDATQRDFSGLCFDDSPGTIGLILCDSYVAVFAYVVVIACFSTAYHGMINAIGSRNPYVFIVVLDDSIYYGVS